MLVARAEHTPTSRACVNGSCDRYRHDDETRGRLPCLSFGVGLILVELPLDDVDVGAYCLQVLVHLLQGRSAVVVSGLERATGGESRRAVCATTPHDAGSEPNALSASRAPTEHRSTRDTHLGAQISRAKYVLDLAGQEDLLELRRKVRSSVGDVKVPDAEHEDHAGGVHAARG